MFLFIFEKRYKIFANIKKTGHPIIRDIKFYSNIIVSREWIYVTVNKLELINKFLVGICVARYY